MKSRVEDQITAGWPEVDCPIPGVSVAVPGGYAGVGLFVTAGFSATAEASVGVAQPCETDRICLNLSIDGTFGLKLAAFISLPEDLLECSASASGTPGGSVSTSGPDANGQCWIEGQVGELNGTVEVVVKALGGTFACTVFSESVTVWEGKQIGPYETACICW